MKDVILYSTGCPKCQVLKAKLNANGIQFEENGDVDQMLSMGITAVPVLEADGKRMEFVEANAWLNGLEGA